MGAALPPVVLLVGLSSAVPSQAIEDEGGNPDEIEVTSEGNKKMPKRPSKGKESLNHCVNRYPVGTEPAVPSVTQDLSI